MNQKTFLNTNLPGNEYPRLQTNKQGEIVLAFYKKGTLTRGVLVGYTPEAKNKQFTVGKTFSDWEVVGELTDYDEEFLVELLLQNKRV